MKNKAKRYFINTDAFTKASPNPGSQKDLGFYFSNKELENTLLALNQLFDRHHRKYPTPSAWRRAVIEELAAWKLGLRSSP